ncbi:hypothetical protein DL95DRAFT_320264 [Leptodontidium sp. 2 PMI_412]|nr:hypothetical protein DL95DRAFT_320264 [Leptodontidium sp. 2 PMI_412]
MSYFDQELFTCTDWRRGSFSQHCSKACRVGETCSTKLITTTRYMSRECKFCKQITIIHQTFPNT